MANIASALNKTLNALENPPIPQTRNSRRPYMGASLLGHHCPRYIWLTFRWAYALQPLPRRVYRIFQRGHREEELLIAELARIGVTVTDEQAEAVFVDGHVMAHCDGIAYGILEAPVTQHLCEFKTMNDRSFKEVTKAKHIKISHPQYYAQVQLNCEGFNLKRYFFMAVNKNDENFYVERGKKDKAVVKTILDKAEFLVYTNVMPLTGYNSTFYKCKFCDAAGICWLNLEFEKNCRTCTQSAPIPGGDWICAIANEQIPLKVQRVGCPAYTRLPK